MLLAVPVGVLGACTAQQTPAPRDAVAGCAGPDASIVIHETQASFIGGMGVTRASATYDVYGLEQINDFSGLYGVTQTGTVLDGRRAIHGTWLENPSGIRMHLRSRDQGLARETGADGMVMELAR
jgi:hypothetical protein